MQSLSEPALILDRGCATISLVLMSLHRDHPIAEVGVAVAGAVWSAGWVAVFVVTLPGAGDGFGFTVFTLIASIAGSVVIPSRWLLLVCGSWVLGAGVGFAVFGLWQVAAPVVAVGAAVLGVWLSRVVPILRLRRNGFRTHGQVVESDGGRDVGFETTHATVRFRVEFADPDGRTRSLEMKESFAVAARPLIGDAMIVYVDPADPAHATAVRDR